MWEVVFVVGVLVLAICLYLQLRLQLLPALVDKVFDSPWIYLAALLRLIVGAALIASAHSVKYSVVISVIGWLSAAGGLLLVATPRDPWLALSARLQALPTLVMRAWLVLGAAFGVFIIYAALP